MDWYCNGCDEMHAPNEEMYTEWVGSQSYSKKVNYCRKTHPHFYQIVPGESVETTRPLSCEWLSRKPIPQGTIGVISEDGCFVALVGYDRSIMNGFTPFVALCRGGAGYLLPDWLRPAR